MKKKGDKDPYTLKDIYEEMELELIASFHRNFARHKKEEQELNFSWEMWQKAKLRNLQEYRRETTSIIYRYEKRIRQTIEQVLRRFFSVGERKANVKIPKNLGNTGEVGKEPPKETQFFGMNKKKLNALVEATKNDFDDVNIAIYRKTNDVYRQTIFKAEYQMASGAISLGKAIDKATESFLDKGIDCIVYKNGRRVNIADYAEMALRTASHRATLLGGGNKRDELGVHLVFVSAHANSCKLCLPWQGKVLIDDVFSHPSKEYIDKYKGKYKLLSEAIKAGLLHPNCRHTIATYFEGVTRLPQTQDPKKALENYNNEQKQRKLEREIRKRKRIYAGTVDVDNKAKAYANLKRAQKNMRDFLKAHLEFKRQYHREKIYDMQSKIKAPYKDDLNVPFQNKNNDRALTLTETKEHKFSDGTYDGINSIVKKANIYTLKNGCNIVTPFDLNESVQKINIKDVANVLESMPQVITKFIKEIEIVDYKNPADVLISKMYGKENFTSAAIGGNKKITFFPSKNNRSIEQIENIIYHESGHILEDEFLMEKGIRLSDSNEYMKIVNNDTTYSGIGFVSKYAENVANYREDLADAFKLYHLDNKMFKAKYPNRYKFIKEWLLWLQKK